VRKEVKIKGAENKKLKFSEWLYIVAWFIIFWVLLFDILNRLGKFDWILMIEIFALIIIISITIASIIMANIQKRGNKNED